jgi:long-subunit fatty acid transport protein
MKKLLLVAALSVATTSVFAQASNFEGAFVEGTLALGSTSLKVVESDGNGSNYSSRSENGLKSFTKGKVSVGYMKAIDSNFLLGVSAGTILGSTTAFNSQSSGDAEKIDTGKFKNNYSVALIPAYAFSDKFALRGRLSYNTMKYEANGLADSIPRAQSAKFNGVGFGLGAQYFFTKNFYGAIDIERIMYSSEDLTTTVNGALSEDKNNLKPTTTMGLISVGYKF